MFKLFLSIAIISIWPLDKVLKRERVNKALFTSIILTIERVVQFLLSTCVLCTHRSIMVLSKQSADPLKDSSIKSAGNSWLESSHMEKEKTLSKQRPPKLKRNGIRAMRIHVFAFPLLLAFMRFHFYFTWFNCDARGDSAQCHSPLFLCTIFTNCKEALDNNKKVHNNATLFHSAVCDWMPFFSSHSLDLPQPFWSGAELYRSTVWIQLKYSLHLKSCNFKLQLLLAVYICWLQISLLCGFFSSSFNKNLNPSNHTNFVP